MILNIFNTIVHHLFFVFFVIKFSLYEPCLAFFRARMEYLPGGETFEEEIQEMLQERLLSISRTRNNFLFSEDTSESDGEEMFCSEECDHSERCATERCRLLKQESDTKMLSQEEDLVTATESQKKVYYFNSNNFNSDELMNAKKHVKTLIVESELNDIILNIKDIKLNHLLIRLKLFPENISQQYNLLCHLLKNFSTTKYSIVFSFMISPDSDKKTRDDMLEKTINLILSFPYVIESVNISSNSSTISSIFSSEKIDISETESSVDDYFSSMKESFLKEAMELEKV